jgi:arylsulfatase A-like enzyme
MRALNAGLWAPAVVAGALAAAHLTGRFAWRVVGARPGLGRRLDSVTLAVALPAALLAVTTGALVWLTWPLVTILPWKPIAAGAFALAAFAAAALAGAGARLDGRSLPWRLGALLLPVALFALALHAGNAERVRKAAIMHAGLAGPLIDALHAASDFDRDGYSSLLGSDCDDWNAEVHPGAFDWPDDGIDDDCNGHQATSTVPPRPPFPPRPAGVPDKPNVVLITIDALRADHLGAYGYGKPTTPNLDAFARQAVLFKNGWAHSPSTRYSVPAILTGRYESTIAWGSPAAHWPPPVLPSNRLLAEMFHDHGYRTAAFLPYHYFERSWGLDQGFDDYDWSLSRLHTNPFGGDPAKTTGSSSRELADLGIQWIGKHQGDPFFLWMHFYDPHYLYVKHPEVPAFASCKSDPECYDGEIAFTDLHVQRVLDALRQAGLWDKTIVIVTADHGEGLGEHGIKLHGYDLYVQQLKVPFIVRVPGIAPRTVEDPVGHVDLFPTLLNLLGAPDEPQLLGRSFVDLLSGTGTGAGAERVVFQEVEYEGPVVKKAVASRDWHLIDNVTPAHTVELYHVSDDPQEEHDVSGLGAREEKDLRGRLAEWMDQSAVPADFAARVAGNLSMKPLAFSQALGADVGGMLVVDGVDVKTPEVRSGGQAEVDVVMHAPKRIPPGWKMFTHFTARDGRFVNADHAPLGNLVPLQKLAAGQYVRDPIKVTLPAGWPPGPLTVELGLFKGSQRAPVSSSSGAGNHVLAATLRVTP